MGASRGPEMRGSEPSAFPHLTVSDLLLSRVLVSVLMNNVAVVHAAVVVMCIGVVAVKREASGARMR